MAEETEKKTPIRMLRSKDFRAVYANTFRVRAGTGDIGIAFGYQTEVPSQSGDQSIIQDEIEIVVTPQVLKLLQLAIDDNVSALEKVIGPIALPPGLVEALAEAKTKMQAAAESVRAAAEPKKE